MNAALAVRARRAIAGLAAGLVGLVLVLSVLPAAADDAGVDQPLVIRSVDARDYPNVIVSLLSHAPDLGQGVALRQDNQEIQAQITRRTDEQGVAVVFVVDVSKSSGDVGLVEHTKLALRELAGSLPANTRIAIVAADVRARISTDLTNNPESIGYAIDTLVASARDDIKLFDALELGLQVLGNERDGNIVLISANHDDGSAMSFDTVRADVADQGVMVFGMGVRTPAYNGDILRSLAVNSGGRFTENDRGDNLSEDISGVFATLSSQVLVRFQGLEETTTAHLVVSVGGVQALASFNPESYTTFNNLRPPVSAALPAGPGFLSGTNGKYIAAVAALVSVTLGALAIMLTFTKEKSALENALHVYGVPEAAVDDEQGSTLVQTALVGNMVGQLEKIAERRGVLAKVERALEQADMPLRAAEALFFYLAFLTVTALISFVLFSPLIMLCLIGFAAMLPPAILGRKAKKRRQAFVAQLPDALQLLGSLRAGYSLMQGVEAVAQEVSDPMGRELRRIVVESRLGRPLEQAMEDAAERMSSPDFSWAIMAIRIQREVGGNLAELLLTVADTMVQRERLRRDVKSLTAEGTMSAIVLGILPPGLGGAMYVINPDYIEPLYTTGTGKIMLGASVLMCLGGFAWMKKMITVDV